MKNKIKMLESYIKNEFDINPRILIHKIEDSEDDICIEIQKLPVRLAYRIKDKNIRVLSSNSGASFQFRFFDYYYEKSIGNDQLRRLQNLFIDIFGG